MPARQRLSEIMSEDVALNLVEPDIYSVYSPGHMPGAFDKFGASAVYDIVACNRVYNRLMWGYSVNAYAALCQELLDASPGGWVLDLACGSLAFTAKIYADHLDRPIVFLDQSLNLLRKGKSRIEKIRGSIPDNVFFLHADALHLPFKTGVFQTIISLNLLHCIDDVNAAIKGLGQVLADGGNSGLTTLVQSRRWSTRYLEMLAGSGALVSRSAEEILSRFDETKRHVTHELKGNLALIRYG